MTIVGYDDNDKTFIIANFGINILVINGYFYMDYEYFNNMEDPIWGNQIGQLYCLHNTTDLKIFNYPNNILNL